MKQILIRSLTLVATVVLVWAVLAIGAVPNQPSLQVGDRAPHDYIARESAEVVDEIATDAARQTASAAVEPVQVRQPEVENTALQGVEELFAAITRSVLATPEPITPPTTATSVAPTTSSSSSTTSSLPTTTQPATTSPEEVPPAEGVETTTSIQVSTTLATTTTVPPVVFTALKGTLFVDVEGNGEFDLIPGPLGVQDAGLPQLGLIAQPEQGAEVRTETQSDGSFSIQVPVGRVTLTVDTLDPEFPPNFRFSTDGASQTLVCRAGDECLTTAIGIVPLLRPLPAQSAELAQAYPGLDPETHSVLTRTASGDVVRTALGRDRELARISTAVQQRLNTEFAEIIDSPETLEQKRAEVSDTPPLVFDASGQRNLEAQNAAADIVVFFLRQNLFVDEALTLEARESAAEAVDEIKVPVTSGERIVAEGEIIANELQLQAITESGADRSDTLNAVAMGLVLVLIVGLLMFYLARFRPAFWAQPTRVSLLGLLIVFAAGAVRLAVEVNESAVWYVLPAVAFGYLSAVLFDARMGALMALTMAVLTAVGTREVGVSVFALLATMAPIGFVSSVSTRRAFRNSVLVSALVVGLVAASVVWYFDYGLESTPWDVVIAAGWASGSALVAALVALAALPFFESLFDITTTLRILDLTDRNHRALQLIQAEAFGTFNHSLMVGTLADAAARAISANNLLARAAAYYHDIGKTENPGYFIENQFGSVNPHDMLSPLESAAIIRAHVTDGIRLAKKYRIPSEVSEGILAHHGDAIMRYFYNRACELEGVENVDPDLYRHVGHKPQSKEMAILMMADSVEGACRAIFSEKDPTPDRISEVVNRVIDEKLNDGQLSQAPLTLAELTKIREAFIEAMVGHYHHRIPYPNFPGGASATSTTPLTSSMDNSSAITTSGTDNHNSSPDTELSNQTRAAEVPEPVSSGSLPELESLK